MKGIFLSYRRSDSAGHVGRLHDGLAARFGATRVFMDVGDIAPGEDFTVALDRELARADTVLVVVGNEWLDATAGGRRRLEDPADHHRLEIERALVWGKRVIPVLIEGAAMPPESSLPESLRPLARHQALELRDSRWDDDFAALARAIDPRTGARSGETRRWPAAIAGLLIAAAVVSAVGFALHSSRPPATSAAGSPAPAESNPSPAKPVSLAGSWKRENGSRWSFAADGDGYRIDEVHYESKQAWLGGRGELQGNRLTFSLDHLFGGNLRLEGSLLLASDGRSMTGAAKSLPSGSEQRILLMKE